MESSVIMQILKYIIAGAGLVTCVVYASLARRHKGTPIAIIDWMIAGIGLYWAFYYVQSILGGLVTPHQVWVRSPLLVTLALFIAKGLTNLRRKV